MHFYPHHRRRHDVERREWLPNRISEGNCTLRDIATSPTVVIQPWRGLFNLVWMYASPIVYPLSLIPEQWQLLYSLNPMVGVIEGFRWTLLGKEAPAFEIIAVGSAVAVVLLLGGILFFKQMEHTFTDII
jgi:ABC-2 type transporter